MGVCPSMSAVTLLKRQGHGKKHMPHVSWPQSCKPCFLNSGQICVTLPALGLEPSGEKGAGSPLFVLLGSPLVLLFSRHLRVVSSSGVEAWHPCTQTFPGGSRPSFTFQWDGFLLLPESEFSFHVEGISL